MTDSPRPVRRRTGRTPLATRVLLSCAAIGVAAGVVLAPFTVWGTLMSTTVPLAYMALTGVWLLGPIVALDLLRLPGTALMTCVVVGLIQMPFGGAGSIVTMVMIGAAVELPFLLTRYRVWAWWLFSLTTAVFLALYAWAVFGYFSMSATAPVVQFAFWALAILSGQAAAALGLVVSARLRRAGVGSGSPTG
ncbi:ECF transporter S component [Mycetocola reblochoni]|uniref:Substrate-specific component YkoE of thiamin-regulated ECF transporter for HydroxyMethylPyrimidine n=2 Tax=Mycetocola reblochoni TaxID=331618 RepID=A0A1R4JWG0_9MICO|nr:ECF transporter S component [Mycetocola reblochoni]SJN36083.1 Substrate-specific component YkoE of thiamin-regulated ECF transporter for HydroxyMethylPyrimidine [Mycetocola reblochoni REB411]